MDSDDPDLEAFKKKSNLCRILRERGLGKAAALKSNLCPNASDPQSIGISSKDNARRDAAHHLSLIRRIYRKITKHTQNGSSKGISTLKLAAGQQGKLMKTQFGQRWRSNIYQLFLFLSIAWKFFTILRPNPIGNC